MYLLYPLQLNFFMHAIYYLDNDKLYVGLVFFLMAVSEAYDIPFLYGLFWK